MSPTAIKVKPLVWSTHQGSPWLAVYMDGHLLIYDLYPADNGTEWRLGHGLARLDRSFDPTSHPVYTLHLSLEAAKAAAQTEWEQFVRAAIES